MARDLTPNRVQVGVTCVGCTAVPDRSRLGTPVVVVLVVVVVVLVVLVMVVLVLVLVVAVLVVLVIGGGVDVDNLAVDVGDVAIGVLNGGAVSFSGVTVVY